MPPGEVTDADVLSFIAAQRQPWRGPKVVRIEDGEAGLSARTISGGWPRSPGCSSI
jgi:hypothetical protein